MNGEKTYALLEIETLRLHNIRLQEEVVVRDIKHRLGLAFDKPIQFDNAFRFLMVPEEIRRAKEGNDASDNA